MTRSFILATLALVLGSATFALGAVPGFDIVPGRGGINFQAQASKGAQFAYIHTTTGTTFRDPNFQTNIAGASNALQFRGAVHIARPNQSPGIEQANFFLGNGGKWTKSGKDFPGALYLEPPRAGAPCYGLNTIEYVEWVSAFIIRYTAGATRPPVIYTTTAEWNKCTNRDTTVAALAPSLWIEHEGSTPGPLPGGWKTYKFWQFAFDGKFTGGQDTFNGSKEQLKTFATRR